MVVHKNFIRRHIICHIDPILNRRKDLPKKLSRQINEEEYENRALLTAFGRQLRFGSVAKLVLKG